MLMNDSSGIRPARLVQDIVMADPMDRRHACGTYRRERREKQRGKKKEGMNG